MPRACATNRWCGGSAGGPSTGARHPGRPSARRCGRACLLGLLGLQGAGLATAGGCTTSCSAVVALLLAPQQHCSRRAWGTMWKEEMQCLSRATRNVSLPAFQQLQACIPDYVTVVPGAPLALAKATSTLVEGVCCLAPGAHGCHPCRRWMPSGTGATSGVGGGCTTWSTTSEGE